MAMAMKVKTVTRNDIKTQVPVLRGTLNCRVLDHYSLDGLKAPATRDSHEPYILYDPYVKVSWMARKTLDLGKDKYQPLNVVLPKAQLFQEDLVGELDKRPIIYSIIIAGTALLSGVTGSVLLSNLLMKGNFDLKIAAVSFGSLVAGMLAIHILEKASYDSAEKFYEHLVELNQKPAAVQSE